VGGKQQWLAENNAFVQKTFEDEIFVGIAVGLKQNNSD
jgi:hypothetical protein